MTRTHPRTHLHSSLAALALALAACGDNRAGDAPPDATPDGALGPDPRAVVVSGDFMPGAEGVLSALSFEPMRVDVRAAPSGAIGNDPVVRRAGRELLVVNRSDGNNITILDEATFAVRAQLATGAGSNPQDVAVVGDDLFVPAYGTAGVVVVARSTGARTVIDLSSLDPDGKPNCVSAYAVGAEVYVACGMLDENFAPRGPGRIAVIDAAAKTVTSTFALAHANPFGLFEQLPSTVLGGDLLIPTVPGLGVGDATSGCVERVQTGAAPKANGCVVTHQQMDGYAARVDFQDLGGLPLIWMIASKYDTAPRGRLWGYDAMTDKLWATPISPASQVLVDLAACRNGKLVVADQTMAANGLRVYQSTAEQTAAPLPIGLAPASSHGLLCY